MKCWQPGQGGDRWARAGSETRPVFVDVTAASASAIDDYVKTEGAWILSLVKREYNIGTVEECLPGQVSSAGPHQPEKPGLVIWDC